MEDISSLQKYIGLYVDVREQYLSGSDVQIGSEEFKTSHIVFQEMSRSVISSLIKLLDTKQDQIKDGSQSLKILRAMDSGKTEITLERLRTVSSWDLSLEIANPTGIPKEVEEWIRKMIPKDSLKSLTEHTIQSYVAKCHDSIVASFFQKYCPVLEQRESCLRKRLQQTRHIMKKSNDNGIISLLTPLYNMVDAEICCYATTPKSLEFKSSSFFVGDQKPKVKAKSVNKNNPRKKEIVCKVRDQVSKPGNANPTKQEKSVNVDKPPIVVDENINDINDIIDDEEIYGEGVFTGDELPIEEILPELLGSETGESEPGDEQEEGYNEGDDTGGTIGYDDREDPFRLKNNSKDSDPGVLVKRPKELGIQHFSPEAFEYENKTRDMGNLIAGMMESVEEKVGVLGINLLLDAKRLLSEIQAKNAEYALREAQIKDRIHGGLPLSSAEVGERIALYQKTITSKLDQYLGK